MSQKLREERSHPAPRIRSGNHSESSVRMGHTRVVSYLVAQSPVSGLARYGMEQPSPDEAGLLPGSPNLRCSKHDRCAPRVLRSSSTSAYPRSQNSSGVSPTQPVSPLNKSPSFDADVVLRTRRGSAGDPPTDHTPSPTPVHHPSMPVPTARCRKPFHPRPEPVTTRDQPHVSLKPCGNNRLEANLDTSQRVTLLRFM